MAITQNNLLLRKFTGTVSESHYIMCRGDKEILCRKPNRKGHIKTQGEKRTQGNFALAQKYASAINKDPEKKSFYTPFRKGAKTEYNLAMADFMRAPFIHSCNLTAYNGLEGDIIEVVALDNFKVISAFCTIYGFDGQILEEGPAYVNPYTDTNWRYKVQYDHPLHPGNKILFTVFDFAGNETRKVLGD